MSKVFEKGIELPDSLWCWEWRIARIYDLIALQVDWALAFGLINDTGNGLDEFESRKEAYLV